MSEVIARQEPDVETRLTRIALQLREEITEAEHLYQSAVQHAIRAGELLNEAHRLVPRGSWSKWLAANFEASDSVARTYMRLANHRTEIADARSITAAVAQIAPSTSVAPERHWEPDPMGAYRRTSSALARALTHAREWEMDGQPPDGYVPVPELRERAEQLLKIIRKWEKPTTTQRANRSRHADQAS